MKNILHRETLCSGSHHSLVLRRGLALHLTDVVGDANISILLINHDDRSDRMNLPDTLKAQHRAQLGLGNVLHSDMGRAMASIIADNFGGHDPIAGLSDAVGITQVYGIRDYQDARNDYYRNGHDSLLVELGRYGLNRRSLLPPLNLFSRLCIADDGEITLDPNSYSPGATVALRADMNLVVLLSSAPHPLNQTPPYPRGELVMEIVQCGIASADDPCRNWCQENRRAFALTEQYFGEFSPQDSR